MPTSILSAVLHKPGAAERDGANSVFKKSAEIPEGEYLTADKR
jgi:hypothetical protein